MRSDASGGHQFDIDIDMRCAAGTDGWRTTTDEPGRRCQCITDEPGRRCQCITVESARVAGTVTSYNVDRKVNNTRTADPTDQTLVEPIE